MRSAVTGPGCTFAPAQGSWSAIPGPWPAVTAPGLAASLRLAAVLDLLPRELELHCISISLADPLADTLSPPVEAAVDRLVAYCCRRLQR